MLLMRIGRICLLKCCFFFLSGLGRSFQWQSPSLLVFLASVIPGPRLISQRICPQMEQVSPLDPAMSWKALKQGFPCWSCPKSNRRGVFLPEYGEAREVAMRDSWLLRFLGGVTGCCSKVWDRSGSE